MRRKSERYSGKKAKASPEKKLEKLKRSRNRRRKQSTSSENESADERSPVRKVETSEVEKKSPQTPVKEGNVEEAQDQVWHVKTAESSGDTGEIQKLKICLTRPPSTPERVDRSPRSKRKHTRATSSSDTPSVEAVEEKKKGKHRSKRTTRESKDESEKNHDSQGDEPDMEMEVQPTLEKVSEISQSVEVTQETKLDEIPMSTTNEETKTDENTKVVESTSNEGELKKEDKKTKTDIQKKMSDADTTVVSPKAEIRENNSDDIVSEKDCVIQNKCISVEKSDDSNVRNSKLVESKVIEPPKEESKAESTTVIQDHKESISESQDRKESTSGTQDQKESSIGTQDQKESTSGTQDQKESTSGTQDQKESTSGTQDQKETTNGTQDQKESTSESQDQKQSNGASQDKESATSMYQDKMEVSSDTEVSKGEDKVENASQKAEYSQNESIKATNETDIVESSENIERKSIRTTTAEARKEEDVEEVNKVHKSRDLERSNSTQSVHEETSTHNGQATPLVISRKRRWGSRANKVTSQKSITISTDVLKEIIPDVKPVEFDEVIEEKKHHKRVEITEKVERPVLPKIVIDNTENMEQHRKELEDKNKENVKARESHLALNRKISIIKDNESIIARPPSPPRHKQSCILYITNLVRPFTLPQLKNLLQRTGRIVEDGFWIDRIKSKCFVKYESEDHAVETRHALHGVTWPVSNPKTLHVDFSNQEAFDKAKANEETDNAQASTIPGTVEDWLREQDLKRERGELEKPWERKPAVREWDVGKNDKEKDKDKLRRDERPMEKRRHRSPERSPEPARKFKKKEEEAPAKLLDDLFRKTKTTPCIYWLPLSAETIAIKEEQRRQHMAEHERRLQELRRSHRRH